MDSNGWLLLTAACSPESKYLAVPENVDPPSSHECVKELSVLDTAVIEESEPCLGEIAESKSSAEEGSCHAGTSVVHCDSIDIKRCHIA